MTLRDLRKAHEKTQAGWPKRLRVPQDRVSRIEARSDFLLSTLRSYVEAMGGKLRPLSAKSPDQQPAVTVSICWARPTSQGGRTQGRARAQVAQAKAHGPSWATAASPLPTRSGGRAVDVHRPAPERMCKTSTVVPAMRLATLHPPRSIGIFPGADWC